MSRFTLSAACITVEQTQNDPLAELVGIDDTRKSISRARDPQPDSAVLRQPLLRDIETGHTLTRDVIAFLKRLVGESNVVDIRSTRKRSPFFFENFDVDITPRLLDRLRQAPLTSLYRLRVIGLESSR